MDEKCDNEKMGEISSVVNKLRNAVSSNEDLIQEYKSRLDLLGGGSLKKEKLDPLDALNENVKEKEPYSIWDKLKFILDRVDKNNAILISLNKDFRELI